MDVREWYRGPPKCPLVVRRPSRMFMSGREALPDIREAISVVREWSEGPPGCSGVVGRPFQISRRPFQMSESGREALPDVWEWS